MAHIYISYWHDDADQAAALRRRFEDAGFAVFFNPDPEAGTAWSAWIDPYLRDSFALVALVTPAARAAEVVTYEWSFALGAQIVVIPAQVAGADLPSRLAALDPLDGGDGPGLLARVRSIAESIGAVALSVPDGAPETVGEAAAALRGHDRDAHGRALAALEASDHPSAADLLARAAVYPIYAHVRRMACEALARTGGDQARRALLLALTDAETEVSRTAAAGIAQFGDDVVDDLAALMRSGQRGSRTAVWALSMIGGAAVVPALVEALQLSGWFGPRTAAVTLGQIGDARAVPGLVAALERDDEPLRRLVMAALRQIGTPEALAALA